MTHLQKEAWKGFGWLVAYLLVIFLPIAYLVCLLTGIAAEAAAHVIANF